MQIVFDENNIDEYIRRVCDIVDILGHWSFWGGRFPQTVEREIALPQRLHESIALVVQGVRRCGKSTLLTQMIGRYRLNPKHCAFLNLEDPRLGFKRDHGLLDAAVAGFRRLNPRMKRAYFFLDEIQGVSGWQRWLRAQLDRPRDNYFVVSGSNANLLSGELSTLLTGRHRSVELFPFSLDEARGFRADMPLDQYLAEGGFPAPLQLPEGTQLRQQYFSDIVERDIRERVGGRSSRAIKQMLQMVFESAGSELSLRRIAGATGLSADTVASYLETAEAAYLVFACPYFAYSERKRHSRNKKYYPVDPGLRRAVVTQTGADQGKALECAVYVALRRRGLSVCYWRDRGEVDFVVETKAGALPVQVSLGPPTEHHYRALEAFYEVHPHAAEATFIGLEEYELGLPGILDRLH